MAGGSKDAVERSRPLVHPRRMPLVRHWSVRFVLRRLRLSAAGRSLSNGAYKICDTGGDPTIAGGKKSVIPPCFVNNMVPRGNGILPSLPGYTVHP